mgnify:CR=1 FL=1
MSRGLQSITNYLFTSCSFERVACKSCRLTTQATALLSAFGRAISEVGAVMIVGGNIDHYTRVMTTAISLETRMGNLEYAMALGIVLIFLTMIIYSLVYMFNLRKR